MTGRRVLETWARNLKWVVLTLVLVPAVAAVLGYYLLRSYEATTAIWVDLPSISSLRESSGSKTVADIYAGRLEQLLLTRRFREHVLNGVEANWGLVFVGPEAREVMLQRIGKGTKVTTRGANLIEIRYRDSSPEMATAIVAEVIQSFQQEAMDLKKSSASLVSTLYQVEVQRAREALAAAERGLPMGSGLGMEALPTSDALAIEVRRDLLRVLEEQRDEAYGSSITEMVAVPATLQIIDASHVPPRAPVNQLEMALLVISSAMVTFIVDMFVVTILTACDQSVRSAADVGAITGALVVEMARVCILSTDEKHPASARQLLGN